MARGEAQVQYTAQLHSRVLAPVVGQRSKSQWLVGSTSLRDENEVRLLEYDADLEALNSAAVWLHPDEVWDIAPCPLGTEQLVTVHSKAGKFGATLWQAQPGKPQLVQLSGLEHTGVVRRALWSSVTPEVLLTLEEGALRKWQLGPADAQCAATGAPGDGRRLWGGAAHPRNGSVAAAVAGNSVQIWDVNNCAKVGEVASAHRLTARDVDWAPNNEHRIVTAGDDCKLRFWDTRALGRGEPLLELGGHSHWVWAARYSPFHDQLLASTSTDCSVCLWYTPQLARQRGAPGEGGSVRAAAGGRGDADGRVATLDEEHEDSVYGLAWSAADPWVLASMSYDGRVVVNRVPKNLKYKILV